MDLDNTGRRNYITGTWITTNTTAGYYGANYVEDEDAGGEQSVRFAPPLLTY